MVKKVLIIISVMLLLCTASFSQDARRASDIWYILDDFSGMLKSHMSPFLIEKDSAQQALNVRANEKYGSLTKRSPMFLLTTAPDSAVKSVFRHYKSDGTKYTIGTYGTKVSYFDSSGTETVLLATATTAKRWTFLTYKDLLIGMDGTDNAKKWDGSTTITDNTDGARTVNDLLTDLGAPFAELNTGSNLDASSWYQYRVAYYDGTTYKFSLARSNPLLTGSSVRDITLTDIPLGPSGTTIRYVYRTVGNSSRANVLVDNTLYLIATISDNSTRTVNDAMTDNTADDDAVPVWSTVAAGLEATPPKSRFCLINTERLFTANDPSGTISGKSSVYWSDLLNPDYFLIGTDFELIRPDDGDEVTFIKNIYGILTIGKTRTISKLYTTATSSANWTVSDPFPYAGCIAPYSAVSTGAGVVFLGRYGIFSFNGQNTKLISDVVTDHIRDILDTSIEEVVGIYHDNRYLMSYTSESTGAANNDRVLILDVVRNSYSLDTKSIDSFAKFDSGDDFGTLYSGSSGSDGNIYAHENSFSRLIYRYKSQLEGGTADSVYIGGTEEIPFISLGSDETWAESTDNWQDSGSKTWMIGSLTGSWYSSISQINASELDKLYWNETLGSTGNATIAVRLASSSGGIAGASWSSEFSDPTGSDLSGETTNDFIQFRASLSSGLFTETPFIFFSDNFVIRMTYKKDGTIGESSVLAVFETGKSGLGGLDLPKRLKEFNIFYEGTAGTMTFQFDNGQGDSYSFDIDLSVDPTSSSTDQYFGTASEKIYVHIPNFENVPTGRFWTFKISEDSTNVWRVNRVAIKIDINDHTTYK